MITCRGVVGLSVFFTIRVLAVLGLDTRPSKLVIDDHPHRLDTDYQVLQEWFFLLSPIQILDQEFGLIRLDQQPDLRILCCHCFKHQRLKRCKLLSTFRPAYLLSHSSLPSVASTL